MVLRTSQAGRACILRTRTFFSNIEGDLHRPWFDHDRADDPYNGITGTVDRARLETPYAHLLFPRQAIDAYSTMQGWARPPYVNPSCAATYLALYRRLGFEIIDVTREVNRVDSSVYEIWADKLGTYDELELRTGEVAAYLRRPAECRHASIPKRPVPAQRSASTEGDYPVSPHGILPDTKRTREWGRNQAEALWSELFARYDPIIDGATMLDLGCSWGYMLRFLAHEFKPGRLIGTDLAPWWEQRDQGWDYGQLAGLVEFHAKDLPTIETIPERSVDLILCTSMLEYMSPEQVEANLERAYQLLRPGGEMLARSRIFVADQTGEEAATLNWLTASTYLAIYARTGFEALDTQRCVSSVTSEDMVPLAEAWPWIASEELSCAALETRLLRPIEAEDLAVFLPDAA